MSEILKNQDESVDSNKQWNTLSNEKSWDDHAKEVSNIEESSEGPVSVPKPEGTTPSPKRPDSESGTPVPKPEFTDLGTGYEGTDSEMSQSEKIKSSIERINNEIAKDVGTEEINYSTSDQEIEDTLKDLGIE